MPVASKYSGSDFSGSTDVVAPPSSSVTLESVDGERNPAVVSHSSSVSRAFTAPTAIVPYVGRPSSPRSSARRRHPPSSSAPLSARSGGVTTSRRLATSSRSVTTTWCRVTVMSASDVVGDGVKSSVKTRSPARKGS